MDSKYKKQKKNLFIISLFIPLFIFVFLFIFSFVYAQYEENKSVEYVKNFPSIEIISLKYTPYPVEPGEKFTIYFLAKNVGAEEAKNVTCKIDEKYPFSAYTQKQKSIGKLAEGREWQFDFLIKVDENASEGIDTLEVSCTDDPKKDAWIIEKIPIRIQFRYSILNIVEVKTEPKIIPQGQKAKLLLSITNDADNVIKDIFVSLNLDDLPFAPLEGLNIKKIKNLEKGQIADIFFDIIALPDAKSGLYKVPITINYTDADGNKQSFSSSITLTIGEEPKFYITVDSVNLKGGKGEIKLKFVNNGPTDIKFFNAKIIDTDSVIVNGFGEIYIGDLDSDDYVIESFYAKLKKNPATIKLELTYRDALNKEYHQIYELSFDLNKVKNEAKTSYWPLVILVIVLIVIAYWYYKKKKGKH